MELTDTLQRLQAEFENYRKRMLKENEKFMANANESLIKSLLPVVDNFEIAIISNKDNIKEKGDFYRGMELIYSQLVQLLEDSGLKPIEATGKKFDPYCPATSELTFAERTGIVFVTRAGLHASQSFRRPACGITVSNFDAPSHPPHTEVPWRPQDGSAPLSSSNHFS
jgi:molecular chaperone GrpE